MQNSGMPCLSKSAIANLMLFGGGAMVLYGATRRSLLGIAGFLAAGGFLLARGMKARLSANAEACWVPEGIGERLHHEAKEHWDYERPVAQEKMHPVDEEGLESFPASDAPSHSASFT